MRRATGPAGWPPQFLLTKEALDPVLLAAGLRFAGMERLPDSSGTATAEYSGRGRRLRLVWEGRERALWIDAARERDAQIVSRWTDIEWSLAGTALPVNCELSDDRIAELVLAAVEFLNRGRVDELRVDPESCDQVN